VAKHFPGSTWPIKRIGKPGNIYVQTASTNEIELWFPDDEDPGICAAVKMSRSDARVLARRINQCLDRTK
jgi:hypothetical protein